MRGREISALNTEISSSYHLNRISKAGPNCLNSLIIDDKKETDLNKIEQNITNFYSALLNGHHRTLPSDLNPVDTGQAFEPDLSEFETFIKPLKILPAEKSAALEADFTLHEFDMALKKCQNNKSPGIDGLSYEFYKAVKNIIGPTLLAIFNEQFVNGFVIPSNRQGITRLLNKVSPKTPTVHQLRPITLLNCDYKILAKMVAKRFRSNADEFVSAITIVLETGMSCHS